MHDIGDNFLLGCNEKKVLKYVAICVTFKASYAFYYLLPFVIEGFEYELREGQFSILMNLETIFIMSAFIPCVSQLLKYILITNNLS